jgi:hypothetical protein
VREEVWRRLTLNSDLEGAGGEEGSELLKKVAMDADLIYQANYKREIGLCCSK